MSFFIYAIIALAVLLVLLIAGLSFFCFDDNDADMYWHDAQIPPNTNNHE
ncbi:hypothetical protein [Bizionia sp. APA-3]|nr:hypothetical protein [Bizionia sp. APA-3]